MAVNREQKLRLLWAASKSVKQGWRTGKHHHECWQALLVVQGSLLAWIDDAQYKLESGDCIIIPAWKPHALMSSRPSKVAEVKFILGEHTFQNILDRVAPYVGPVSDHARQALQRIIAEGEQRAPYHEEIAAAAFEEFLWYVVRTREIASGKAHGEQAGGGSREDGEIPRDIRQIMLYIERHAHLDDSLDKLGREFGYNPAYLCEKFSSVAGVPPMRYRTEVRVRKAKEMLAESDLTIHQISDALGYKSDQHFSRLFRKETGVSPRQFRQAHRNRRLVEILFVDEPTAIGYGVDGELRPRRSAYLRQLS